MNPYRDPLSVYRDDDGYRPLTLIDEMRLSDPEGWAVERKADEAERAARIEASMRAYWSGVRGDPNVDPDAIIATAEKNIRQLAHIEWRSCVARLVAAGYREKAKEIVDRMKAERRAA